MTIEEKNKYDEVVASYESTKDYNKLSDFILINGLWRNVSLKDIPGEIWVAVPKYNGHILCSSYGRVKSVRREVFGRNKEYRPKYTTERIIVQHLQQKQPYLRANICVNSVNKTERLHILIAQCFHPNAYNKPTVNHKNGIKFHNEAYNLEWNTHSENQKHAFRELGRRKTRYWEGKKREDMRRKIICLNSGIVYDSLTDACNSLGLRTGVVCEVCQGKRKSVKGYKFIYAS